MCEIHWEFLTGNVFAAARAIGQQADVLATPSGRLVGSGLGVKRLGTGRWETVDVDVFLGLGRNGAGWFESGT